MACPPDDVEKALRIRETSGVPIFIQGTSIPECVSMLRRADLLVSVDTGQVHIAAALGTPVLSLAGSTLTGTCPYSEKAWLSAVPETAMTAPSSAAVPATGNTESATPRDMSRRAWPPLMPKACTDTP